ncbi:MAG: pyroglutamyl-peptidase I [Propionibacteriaceae bacterium]|nr:pyroglutamyl-peptidase I [Propionibacteriaceae bacterium]
MRVLVTGFAPFGGDAENASAVVLHELTGSWSDSRIDLVTALLPVEFDGAPRALAATIVDVAPDVVICLGEAGGRTLVTPERWAGPLAHARIPDNAGHAPSNEQLDGHPEPFGSRLDADAVAEAIRSVGVPAEASSDAGLFVCNATFRALLRDHCMPAAFIHVPAVRHMGVAVVGAETDADAGGAPAPGLSFEDLVRAVTAVIRWAGH